MTRIVAGLVGMLALSGAAYAQTPDSRGYVEAVAQSAFGDVTSQSFGGEAGYFITPNIGVFVEGGQVRDAAPSALGAAAQKIAAALSIGFSVREPVSFFGGGIRYAFTGYGKLEPYVLGGAGAASVKRDVKFTAGGVDITSSLGSAPYYTVLGTDLTGTLTKPMFTAGGGVAYHATSLLRVDLGYRFARIMTDTSGTNVSRAGIGIGVTF
jgi:opacity protein-like surface antigen